MEVPLCTAGCDISPVIFLSDSPKPSKPVQHFGLEFLQMEAMAAAAAVRECTTEMVGVEVLHLRQCSIIRFHIARITCHHNAIARFSQSCVY